MVNVHAIGTGLHSGVVIALSELAECRQTSQAHPDLEWLVVHKIRVVIIAVVVWVSEDPVWGHRHICPIVRRWSVKFLVAGPGDVGVVLHHVRLIREL